MNELQILRDFVAILPRSQRPRLALLAAGLVITGLLEMAGLGVIFVYISLLNETEAGGFANQLISSVGLTSTIEIAIWLGVALIIVFAAKAAMIIGVYALLMRFAFDNFRLVGEHLFRAFLTAPYEYHLSKTSVEAQRAINSELPQVFNSAAVSLVFLAANFLTSSLMFVALLVVEPLATLMAIVLLGGATTAFYFIHRGQVDRSSARRFQHVTGMIRWVNQALGAIREIRVFGREAFFYDNFQGHISGLAESDRRLRVLGQMPSQINELILVLGIVGIIVGFIVAGRPLPSLLPTLAMFGVAGVRVSGMVSSMVGHLQSVQFAGPAISNIRRLLDETARWQEAEFASEASRVGGPIDTGNEIVLRDVSYAYPGATRGALNDLTLTIHHGSRAAFVGPSGAGKSTIVAVLLGLLKPTQGEVLIGGQPLASINRSRVIAFVPQTIFLLDDTLRANVLFGLPASSISDEQMWAAIETAQLADFVRARSHGLDVRVGENGVALSGGERQRLGIARALLKRPSILVLDEATASLDTITERRLTENIMRFRDGITTIIVAHRLSTVRTCDAIHYLEDGRLVASGSFDELMVNCAGFRKMVLSAHDDLQPSEGAGRSSLQVATNTSE